MLSQAELDFFVDAAIARWSEAGLTAGAARRAGSDDASASPTWRASISARSRPAQITLDADAAGHGWYLDATPLDDAEFGNVFSATRMQTDPTGAPAGHYDLLTTVMHEMGHALGLGDSLRAGDRDDLMYGWLFSASGGCRARARPTARSRARSPARSSWARRSTSACCRPARPVTIQWQATIDPQTNQLIVNPVNTGTVSATNAVGFPDQNTNTVTTTLDTLILGGTIWNDNGAGGGIAGNGIKDGTEPGVSGVTLSLFADANDDNVLDRPATPARDRRPTAGGGDYSFTGLAPGNYIVRVDQANFDAGGALAGLHALADHRRPSRRTRQQRRQRRQRLARRRPAGVQQARSRSPTTPSRRPAPATTPTTRSTSASSTTRRPTWP